MSPHGYDQTGRKFTDLQTRFIGQGSWTKPNGGSRVSGKREEIFMKLAESDREATFIFLPQLENLIPLLTIERDASSFNEF